MDLFSNSSLGDKHYLLWQQFSPVEYSKWGSAAADQSSRQADITHEPAATVQSYYQAHISHEPAVPV